MGFGSIATQVLFIFLFLVILGSYIGLVGQHQNTVQQAQIERQELESQKLQTSIELSSAYNGTHILFNITNSGAHPINTTRIDFYVNDERLNRTHENKTTSFPIDNMNANLLDPGDIVSINYRESYISGTYSVIASTPLGIKAGDNFIVP